MQGAGGGASYTSLLSQAGTPARGHGARAGTGAGGGAGGKEPHRPPPPSPAAVAASPRATPTRRGHRPSCRTPQESPRGQLVGVMEDDKATTRGRFILGIAYMLDMGVCGIILVAIGSNLDLLADNCSTNATKIGTVFIARGASISDG